MTWQNDYAADYGAWIGARERAGHPDFKLYAEVPSAAPWADWECRQVGEPSVLPSRGVRLCMLGIDPASGALELYYRLNELFPLEIDTLLRRVGLPSRSREMIDVIEGLEGHTVRRAIPCTDLGFSYALLPGGGRAFTLYAFAHSLIGGDDVIRNSILALLKRRGWNGSAYQAISEPVADLSDPLTFHGMVGCTVSADACLRFTAGIAPHPQSSRDEHSRRGPRMSMRPATRTLLEQEVLAEQAQDGGFRSRVGTEIDENCFVTSLVLLELSNCPADAASRALDFIERCEDPRQPGAFRFYPWNGDSPRLRIMRLDDDADDTALAWLTLLKYGRRDAHAARQALARIIEPHRTHFLRGDEPPWVQLGAARTWLIDRAADNPVDCCVNANVAGLYAAVGSTTEPGFLAACETVARAVRSTSGSPPHLRVVAPFYRHPLELLYAVQRAVRVGASPLVGTLAEIKLLPWAAEDRASGWLRERGICCNAGGLPVWIAPALQAARQLSLLITQD